MTPGVSDALAGMPEPVVRQVHALCTRAVQRCLLNDLDVQLLTDAYRRARSEHPDWWPEQLLEAAFRTLLAEGN